MSDARTYYWMPMDQYIGGTEHGELHMPYARYWTKIMRDMGLVNFARTFQQLTNQGVVCNHAH